MWPTTIPLHSSQKDGHPRSTAIPSLPLQFGWESQGIVPKCNGMIKNELKHTCTWSPKRYVYRKEKTHLLEDSPLPLPISCLAFFLQPRRRRSCCWHWWSSTCGSQLTASPWLPLQHSPGACISRKEGKVGNGDLRGGSELSNLCFGAYRSCPAWPVLLNELVEGKCEETAQLQVGMLG